MIIKDDTDPKIKNPKLINNVYKKERDPSFWISPLSNCATASTSSFFTVTNLLYSLISLSSLLTNSCLYFISVLISSIKFTASVNDADN